MTPGLIRQIFLESGENIEIIIYMESNGLTYEGETYTWLKSFSDLKSFVEESLNIKGKCSSPGGDAKLFKSVGEGEFSIKWYGQRSKRLAIQSDNLDNYLNLKFESLSNQRRIAIDISQEVASEILETEVCHRLESGACSCVR